MMTASLITTEVQSKLVSSVCTVAEAATKLGCSESTIRKHAKRLGVKKINGSSVSGFILFESHPVPVTVAYAS